MVDTVKIKDIKTKKYVSNDYPKRSPIDILAGTLLLSSLRNTDPLYITKFIKEYNERRSGNGFISEYEFKKFFLQDVFKEYAKKSGIKVYPSGISFPNSNEDDYLSVSKATTMSYMFFINEQDKTKIIEFDKRYDELHTLSELIYFIASYSYKEVMGEDILSESEFKRKVSTYTGIQVSTQEKNEFNW